MRSELEKLRPREDASTFLVPSHWESLGVPKYPASFYSIILGQRHYIFLVSQVTQIPSDPVLMPCFSGEKNVYFTGQSTRSFVCSSFVQPVLVAHQRFMPGGGHGHSTEQDKCERDRTRTQTLLSGAHIPMAEKIHVYTGIMGAF